MGLLKSSIVLLAAFLLVGCVGYVDSYGYGTSVYIRDSVYYHDRDPRYTIDLRVSGRRGVSGYYYVPSPYEHRMGRCEIPGYSLMLRSGLCESRETRYRGRLYLDPIDRFPNCDRYYRGHLLPEGRYYCR